MTQSQQLAQQSIDQKIKIEVVDTNGSKVEEIEIDNIFASPNQSILWYYVRWYLSSQRAGTRNTKTISDVRGGGRKPWQQKHTGRARQGSIRNPHWVGGAVAHGPHPKDFSYKINAKEKVEALRTAIALKYQEGKLKIVSEFNFNQPKTKTALGVIRNIDAYPLLVITKASKKNVYLSFRNIPLTYVVPVDELNAYHIANFDYSVFEKDAFMKVVDRIQKIKSNKQEVQR